MRPLYKYAKNIHSEGLLKDGGVRIGTLHDFRKTEHAFGISDINEGKKSVSHYIDDWNLKNQASGIHRDALKKYRVMDIPDHLTDISFEDVNMVMRHDEPNCFIHCTSFVFSNKVMREFDGANSCVEIFNVAGFYQNLTRKLNETVPLRAMTIQPVVYKPREEIWNGKDWGIEPKLVKERKYAGQFEVRAIWIPKSTEGLEPIKLYEGALSQFCRGMKYPFR